MLDGRQSLQMQDARQAERGYLCVDAFIRDAVGARALASALELGLVDLLGSRADCSLAELGSAARIDRQGVLLLLGLLRASGVVEGAGDAWRLSQPFRAALEFRDLIEAKLDFVAAVGPDFLERFTQLLRDPAGFFGEARLFELFSYDRCLESTPGNVAATARWMRFTTALTRYEAAACLAGYDFSRHRQMLDVGGNSGEFSLHACRAAPGLRATVFDLPVVCEIGERHVASQPEGPRIGFARASQARGAMPAGSDLVTFKSMLHDWPDEPMQEFLDRAHDALEPGGTLLIFERCPVEIGDSLPPYASIPLLLFFRAYRSPEDYRQPLSRAGFTGFKALRVDLDMPFMLVTARKQAGA